MVSGELIEVPARAATPNPVVRETHTGIAVLVGDKAYKAKKPLATDVLDFSTPALREKACAREVELNKRLAPESYLGVAHLSDPAGGCAEPVIVMRRYPDSSRLATMVTSGVPVERHLADIAQVLAGFHDQAQRGPGIDSRATSSALAARWRENIFELKRLAPIAVSLRLIEHVEHLANNYLTGRAALFRQRIHEGQIVDRHGDLLADDIFCLPEDPALLDCVGRDCWDAAEVSVFDSVDRRRGHGARGPG